ncbi:MAG: 5-formyltetrahydrofolate cyclo-ligase, partial [Betaproteobacteria bacterium]|nr:5-formyltetrahydrofolate cyclo-ligase [Betaproteobacteria bacterium]
RDRCLAVDSTGRRLGQGGGYYDRSIAGLDQEARKRTVAIGYSICEVVFEPQAHDLAFAAVISERALHA